MVHRRRCQLSGGRKRSGKRTTPSRELRPRETDDLDRPHYQLRTCTGKELWFVVPSPSWPYPLSPQHHTAPLFTTAQVCPVPAEIAIAAAGSPTTDTGTKLSAEWSSADTPFPSSPHRLFPQHWT